MSILHLSENLGRLRKERKITQEELADFVGVTKASVSKWENGQSMPDIMLLPQLASFFDVTVDALLGYEPQMSKEQIRTCYQKLAKGFAEGDFNETMAESEKLVKKYYACYPFLNQICVLWMNHYMLPPEKQRQHEVLEKIEKLCHHILKHTNDLIVVNQAMEMKALADLQRGNAAEVVDALEELCIANQYEQKSALLIQAYFMQGDIDKADQTLQVEAYRCVMQLLSQQILFLAVHAQDRPRCREIIKRSDDLIESFQLENLNPNAVAQFQYQAAIIALGFGEEDKALHRLDLYAKAVEILFRKHITLEGDDYFNKMDDWFMKLDLGGERVRDPKLVAESAKSIFSNPIIQGITDKAALKQREKKVAQACEVK